MIIKKKLKSVVPCLKRRRTGGETAECSLVNRKKRKIVNGYYPMHLLGEVAAGVIPFYGYGLQKFLSSSASAAAGGGGGGGGVGGESWCARPKEESRPPLVRTSRGRVQVLPSRFNDSVLDNWKKEKDSSKNVEKGSDLDSEYVPFSEKGNKFSFKPPKIRKSNEVKSISNQCRKFSPLSEDEIEELRNGGLRNCGFKYYSSPSSLHEEEELEEFMELNGINKLYSSEDFDEGDIVWAVSGRHCPAWPAIVLNQESQVPQQVLNFRVLGGVCVMFFGYSGNGTQRDYAWIKRRMMFPFLDYVDRFQGQTELNDSKPGDLRSAIDEAFLAENGFNEMLMVEINAAAGNSDYLHSLTRVGGFKASDSNKDRGCKSVKQNYVQASRLPYYVQGSSTSFMRLPHGPRLFGMFYTCVDSSGPSRHLRLLLERPGLVWILLESSGTSKGGKGRTKMMSPIMFMKSFDLLPRLLLYSYSWFTALSPSPPPKLIKEAPRAIDNEEKRWRVYGVYFVEHQIVQTATRPPFVNPV
ncbi:hypothetical protein RD792_007982 [Penstemon davidsonii]|uniref:PWWP domain-containing protein n=1 Tax=Penstemon davidsonii TaxID=160366 RepID=A0ABR0D806_9LAMI|nr:hypothetical protein RD792_007982 [Penstemon davidsonii]